MHESEKCPLVRCNEKHKTIVRRRRRRDRMFKYFFALMGVGIAEPLASNGETRRHDRFSRWTKTVGKSQEEGDVKRSTAR